MKRADVQAVGPVAATLAEHSPEIANCAVFGFRNQRADLRAPRVSPGQPMELPPAAFRDLAPRAICANRMVPKLRTVPRTAP